MKLNSDYRYTYAGHPVPEAVFFIGPSPTNSLSNMADYHQRVRDTVCVLEEDHPLCSKFSEGLSAAFGQKVELLTAEIRQGGWKGKICPYLCITTPYSKTIDGRTLYMQFTKEQAKAICQLLRHILDAHWVVCWNMAPSAFQVIVDDSSFGKSGGR